MHVQSSPPYQFVSYLYQIGGLGSLVNRLGTYSKEKQKTFPYHDIVRRVSVITHMDMIYKYDFSFNSLSR